MPRTLIGLGLSLALVASARAEFSAELFHTLCSSVQMVRAAGPEGRAFFGTGVLIGNGRAVTNCHVVRDASRVSVGRGSFTAAAEAVAGDTERDLCVVQVPGAQGHAPELRQAATLVAGETVYAVGYSGGMRARVSEGRVVAMHTHAGGKIIQTSAQFSLGASGGGLFDAQGRLVGVLTFYRRSGDEPMFYALPVDWIDDVVARGFNPVAPLHGPAPFWAASEDALPAFLRVPRTMAANR